MRGLLILGCAIFCLALPGVASADRQQNLGMKGIFQSSQKVRIGNRQAAGNAKINFPQDKILSVKLIESNGPPVYKIKMLSNRGVVKFVYVDGMNGEVFE